MLSIITPCFNSEKYIESCIQNVIEQNFNRVEHIIVDGSSTDATIEIIKSYAEKHSHIHWISEKDKGQSDAMNKGIAMAKFDVISFLNVDDYYEPNVFRRVMPMFETLPPNSFITGNCNLWDAANKHIGINKPDKTTLYDIIAFRRFPANPSAYFYHKTIHEKIGGYKIVNKNMDLHFILDMVQVANVVYVNETYGNFCIVEDSKTSEAIGDDTMYEEVREIMLSYRTKLNLIDRNRLRLLTIKKILKRFSFAQKLRSFILCNIVSM